MKKNKKNTYDLGWKEESENFTVVKILDNGDGEGCYGMAEVCDIDAYEVFKCVRYYMEDKGIPEFEVDGMIIKLEKKAEVEE